LRHFRNIALTIAFLLGIAALSGYGAPSRDQVTRDSLPACQTEDSDNCYWDAQTMGNGQGHSFYVIAGNVTYTN
jgi:hypothetical protein